ncbi:molybdopterin molybdotransferase MoeA [Propioniciclava coleopterorum]|uniref:molybdopterin molybdotransferase MoeA n=1 Tax=Propioniciclava coleopterorum TaxID=2714937 RepID=UPI00197D5435|nr:molybdopterin molybdotransferase MoeA [Propioniciclava coleopterorum]
MAATTRPVLSVEEYLAEVLALVRPEAASEAVPLREAAGRTLAEPVLARGHVPAFANSAMDGFALRVADASPGVELSVVGDVFAGSDADPLLGRGEAVRIMTGAPVPSGADAVIPVEEVVELGPDRIRLAAEVRPGQHIRGAGEDVRAGDQVLPAGTVLGPRALAAAAAAGAATIECVRRPWVGIIATGDELVAPGQPLRRGQIYESNATFLGAAVARDGAIPLVAGAVEDTPAALTQALEALAARCDLIVVSGGVSVGDADVTRIVLERAGHASATSGCSRASRRAGPAGAAGASPWSACRATRCRRR